VYSLSERAKLGLLCLLWLLVLGIVAFTAVNTLQAAQSLQRQYKAVKAGDVSTIRPWMTVHVISHIYQVPEDYLFRSLNIDNPRLFHHATLSKIANRKRVPVDQVIRTIQSAILDYRKEHPYLPTPALRPPMGHFSPMPGRTRY